MSAGPDRDLARRLQRVEQHVHAVVRSRTATDPTADDPFRGLYITDDDIDRLTATSPRWNDAWPTTEQDEPAALDEEAAGRLSHLAQEAGLTDLDVDLLLIALAPDLDSRYEKYYGYLNDDVSRRRASIGLALELAGASPLSADDRHRLSTLGPLSRTGLVLVEDLDRPFLTRSLRVPDRVAAHLLGDDNPDDELVPLLRESHPYASPLSQSLTRGLSGGVTLMKATSIPIICRSSNRGISENLLGIKSTRPAVIASPATPPE